MIQHDDDHAGRAKQRQQTRLAAVFLMCLGLFAIGRAFNVLQEAYQRAEDDYAAAAAMLEAARDELHDAHTRERLDRSRRR